MRIWGIIRKDGKIVKDNITDTDMRLPLTDAELSTILKTLCYDFDLACPVVLSKHVRDMASFSRTAFLPNDFMEAVDFDKLEIEAILDKKRK